MAEKELISPNENWPRWLYVLATIFNFIGILIFIVVLLSIRSEVISNEVISSRITSYLGLVGYASALGILTLVAGSSIIILLNPWINFRNLMNGDGFSKLSGAIIFSSIVLSLSLVILAAN